MKVTMVILDSHHNSLPQANVAMEKAKKNTKGYLGMKQTMT